MPRQPIAPVPAAASGITLLLLLIWVTVGNLAPFELRASWIELKTQLLGALTFSADDAVIKTVLERLVCFAPIGFFVHWNVLKRRWRHPYLAALVLLAVIVCTNELAQIAFVRRHARMADGLMGLLAGSLGLMLSGSLSHRWRGFVDCDVRHLRPVGVSLIVLGNLMISALVLLAHTGLTMGDWDPSFPLLVANERTGDRPWKGAIRGFAIYDRRLMPAEVVHLSGLPMTPEHHHARQRLDPLVLYSFAGLERQGVVRPASGRSTLSLLYPPPPGPNTWTAEPDWMSISGPIVVRSRGPAADISNAIRVAEGFTVEADIACDNIKQDGPVRIVSISHSPSARNVTLGQSRDRVAFRFRTGRTGTNGSRISYRSRRGVLDNRWHHVAASYGNGVARIFVDGQEARAPMHLYSLSALLFRFDSAAGRVIVAVTLFVPMGLLAALAFGPSRPAISLAWGPVAASCLPLALYVAAAVWTHKEVELEFVFSSATAGFLGILGGRSLMLRAFM